MDAPSDPAPDAKGRGSDSGDADRLEGGDCTGGANAADRPSAAPERAVEDEDPAAADVDPEQPGDGGVLFRLAHRTASAAGVLGVVVLLVTGTGLLWPGWFARPIGLVVGVLLVAGCTVCAVMLLRRSGSWTGLTGARLRESPGVPALVGAPQPLHGQRPVVMRRRRLVAQVVPIRSATGPWTGGAALVVHGRADEVALRADDDVVARWVHPRGPYLLERPADGALFAAERSTLGAW